MLPNRGHAMITPEHITAFALVVTALSGLVWNLRRKR
jgi:hypothetical protein